MNNNKIFNDPIYGFVTLRYGILFDIIEHPFFQRLRRIKQMGLADLVYPGALHTRFHHALGVVHLTSQAIDVLRSKNIEITDEEAEALNIAAMLHDVGHGPFSHALEYKLINIHHEQMSLLLMKHLNEVFPNKLSLAIEIFTNQYPKRFLYQLVSGQLDLDRLDYLNRDSFYSGVREGVVGYDRIIKMLYVKDGELMVEEKGIYSVENFLIARRFMYWQVYLHKTSLVVEQMLIRCITRARTLIQEGATMNIAENLLYFLKHDIDQESVEQDTEKMLLRFTSLDDMDIMTALKIFAEQKDFELSFLSKGILDRKLMKIELSDTAFESDYLEKIRQKLARSFAHGETSIEKLIWTGKQKNVAYSREKDEINILFKNDTVKKMSEVTSYFLEMQTTEKYYLCYPKCV